MENPGRFLPEATVIREVTAPANGHISAIDGEALGRAVVDLGGGRRVESDPVDPAVGLSDVLGVGAAVARGQPLLRIHAARIEDADRAAKACLAAITITEDGPSPAPSAVLLETLGLD